MYNILCDWHCPRGNRHDLSPEKEIQYLPLYDGKIRNLKNEKSRLVATSFIKLYMSKRINK